MDSVSSEPGNGPAATAAVWPKLRALLIALVLLLQVSLGAPWPDLRPSDLRYGVAQDELKRWSGLLGQLGVDLPPDALADRVLAIGRTSTRIQKTLHGPFKPWLRVTGTGQSWGLFAYPDPYAGRLVIRARRTGETEWRTLYQAPREGDPWLVDLVESRRVRGIYDDSGDRPKAGGIWKRLCDYLALRVMLEDPSVEEVELRFDQRLMPIPGRQAGTKPEKPLHTQLRTRAGQPSGPVGGP